MKIEKVSSPVFGAKYMTFTHIRKTPAHPEELAYLVKIDPFNEGDINALKNVANYWLDGKFVTNIYHAACAIKNDSKYYNQNQIYALTKQTSDLENLDDDKIMGLVHVSPLDDNALFIEHIEANTNIVKALNREYSGIGKRMLDLLKELTDKIACFPSSAQSVKDFYYKNGFKEVVEHSNLFVWKK